MPTLQEGTTFRRGCRGASRSARGRQIAAPTKRTDVSAWMLGRLSAACVSRDTAERSGDRSLRMFPMFSLPLAFFGKTDIMSLESIMGVSVALPAAIAPYFGPVGAFLHCPPSLRGCRGGYQPPVYHPVRWSDQGKIPLRGKCLRSRQKGGGFAPYGHEQRFRSECRGASRAPAGGRLPPLQLLSGGFLVILSAAKNLTVRSFVAMLLRMTMGGSSRMPPLQLKHSPRGDPRGL